MRKLLLLSCLLLITGAAARTASAETLTLKGVGSTTFGGASAGPYSGQLNSQSIEMLCVSFDRVTPLNQPWTVEVHQLNAAGVAASLYGSQANALNNYQRAAWLLDQMQYYPAEIGAIHGAVWNLFNPGVTPDTVGSNKWLVLSYDFLSGAACSEFDFSRFRILTPTALRNGPQEFLTKTPEPATMVLLGSGLFGLAGAIRRRRRAKGI